MSTAVQLVSIILLTLPHTTSLSMSHLTMNDHQHKQDHIVHKMSQNLSGTSKQDIPLVPKTAFKDAMAEEVVKFPEELDKLINNVLVKLGGTKTCDLCKSVSWILQTSFYLNEDKIATLADNVCKYLHVEDADICDGIVKLFKNEVLTVMERLVLSPKELCGLILGPMCSSVYDPFQMWNISLPPPAKQSEHPKHTADPPESTLRILHVSDLHIDMEYTVGANADCDRPMCCRNTSGQVKSPAGTWGSRANCDVPPWTVEHLFKHLADTDKFDYILWTGDLPSHADWNQTRENQLSLVNYLTDLFLKYFPNTLVYSALGNHEGLPVNSFPPPYITGVNSVSWLYDSLVESWTHWLPGGTSQTIKYGAYYTAVVRPGFRIVSLNMDYCNTQNWWMLLNTTDPAGQLRWLIDVLYGAELAGEKVHVIGHIPPGSGDCMKAWSWNYYKVVDRFRSVISGQFFGHTHTDHIELFYDEATLKQPVSVAYMAPSVTTYPYLNPGYRVYTVDGFYEDSSWAVLDHDTFILNLTEANTPGKSARWQKEYSAKSAYNMSGLTPADWQSFTDRVLHDPSTANTFAKYFYKTRPDQSPCDHKCAAHYVCSMRSGRSHDPQLCNNITVWEEHQAWLRTVSFC